MILAFNKPYGVLSQFTPDRPGQRTLADFGFPSGVYPLGRLDMDSEGLLLLSDEPGLNNSLLDPKFSHERSYLAQVEGVPSQTEIQRLTQGGIIIKGHRCLPCRAELLSTAPQIPPRDPPIRVRRHIPDTWIRLHLTEGKNRQVRRMTAAVGHPTLRLIRESIGGFSGMEIESGVWKALDSIEIRTLGI